MRFEISALLSMALAVQHVAAVDITFFALSDCKSGGTSGNTTTFWNAGDMQCLSKNGRSVRFSDLPGGAKGQTYSNGGCSAYVNERSSSGCITSSSTMRSANWFYPFKKLVRKAEPLGPTRFSVSYQLPDETTREIEVPVGPTTLDEVYKLLDEKDFDALAKYPTFVKDA